MIDLLIGKPSTDLLPAALFAKAAQKALERSDAPSLILQYGPELGNANFLDRLARFLSLEYHSTVESQHLCVSTGASFALQHMLTLLTRPESTTRFAFFQNPTYHLVYNIFLDCGFKKDQFIPVSENDTGLDVDALAEFLEKHFPQGKDESNNDDGFYSAVMYCVPTHANPTSSILSAAKRARLVQLARRYNMLIICDDVYDILTFDGNVPKRLVAYDLETEGPPVVVSNGSFSKILAPGARVGWMEAQTALIQRLGTCGSFISGGSPAYFASQIISEMLTASDFHVNLHNHVQFLRVTLRVRLHQGLWGPYLRYLMPLGCKAHLPAGGYFLWVKLPPRITHIQVKEQIRQHELGVNVGAGDLFFVPGVNHGDTHLTFVRLCFAHYSVDKLREAVVLLAKAIEYVIAAHDQDDASWSVISHKDLL